MYLPDLAAAQILCAKHGPNKKRGRPCCSGDREGTGGHRRPDGLNASDELSTLPATLEAALGEAATLPSWGDIAPSDRVEHRCGICVRVNKLGQRDHQADHRHGSMGCGREMVVCLTEGYRDCEDYVLLKCKMLKRRRMAARSAAHHGGAGTRKGEGHAVLTVKSDKGEFVLDNQNESVLAWTRPIVGQAAESESHPNVWVLARCCSPAVATASSRDR